MTENTTAETIDERAAQVFDRVKARAEGQPQEWGSPLTREMLTKEVATELRELEQAVTTSIGTRAAAAINDLDAKRIALEQELDYYKSLSWDQHLEMIMQKDPVEEAINSLLYAIAGAKEGKK